MVSFGAASGPVEGVAVNALAAKGSLYLTRPTLFSYCASRAELEASASRVFQMLAGGQARAPLAADPPVRPAGHSRIRVARR